MTDLTTLSVEELLGHLLENTIDWAHAHTPRGPYYEKAQEFKAELLRRFRELEEKGVDAWNHVSSLINCFHGLQRPGLYQPGQAFAEFNDAVERARVFISDEDSYVGGMY